MTSFDLVRILSDQKSELEQIDVSQLCPRKEEAQFELESDLAQVVIGVRRSGKSMLCLKVLKESGKTFGYVNFDDELLADLSKKTCIPFLKRHIWFMGTLTISSLTKRRMSRVASVRQ